MNSAKRYTKSFFASIDEQTLNSAQVIVPIIKNFIQPKSVIDVGCGLGYFLKAFEDQGVTDILGIDGAYVNTADLHITQDKFKPHDLTKPLDIAHQFDLVVSLEVAEHLPEETSDQFVQTLVSLGPAILFSAAIPDQGGTHHVNEQWPDYWAEKFLNHNYVCYDCIRPLIWDNANVAYWYAQNTLLFVQKDAVKNYDQIASMTPKPIDQLSLVHPKAFIKKADEAGPVTFIRKMARKVLNIFNR